MTELQQLERRALVGDRDAVLRVVFALRAYREAVSKCLESRWRDGAIDGAKSSEFAGAISEIEGRRSASDD